MVTRNWGNEEMGSCCLIGMEFQFYRMTRIIEVDDGDGDKPGTKLLTKMPSKTQNSCAHPSRGGLWWRGSISVTGVLLASSTAQRVGLLHHGGLYVSGTEQVGVGLSQAGPFSQVKSESPPDLGVLVLSSVIPTLFMSRLSEF